MSLQNAKARARVLIFESEGLVEHMYLDTVSQVTVGYGTMLPDAASASGIEMLDRRTRKTATREQKADEWRTLRALSPADTPINQMAQSYEEHTRLIITDAEAVRLFEVKMDGFIAMLRLNYPGFDRFPEDAQVAMLDMAYNLGNRIHTVFRSFTRAVNRASGPDWATAAQQSNRPQLSAVRNREVYDLFMSASRERAR